MRTILVINSKGGSGKTTLTTNLASYFASQHIRTAIMDCDPQGSSMQWLRQRPAHFMPIHGADAAPATGAAQLASHKRWVPDNIETLIIDAPAGVKGLQLKDLVRRSNYILIPVSPSPVDIHATADFVKDLYLIGGARSSGAKIAVVANRVRQSSPGYEPLERFLTALKLPLLTRISDSDNYIHAVGGGIGVYEMDEASTRAERQEFLPILNWLGEQLLASAEPTPTSVAEKTGRFAELYSTGKMVIANILSATGRFKIKP
jgi:chromosome partitioning protein